MVTAEQYLAVAHMWVAQNPEIAFEPEVDEELLKLQEELARASSRDSAQGNIPPQDDEERHGVKTFFEEEEKDPHLPLRPERKAKAVFKIPKQVQSLGGKVKDLFYDQHEQYR